MGRRQIMVVAALIEREGRVLICQRRKQGRHGLKWEFPGGKVEPGETPRQALARELREELGLEATVGEEIVRYEYRYGRSRPILLIFYRVAFFRGTPDNRVFEQIAWEPPARLSAYDFLDGDADFIRRLARGEFGGPDLNPSTPPPASPGDTGPSR
jgi:8-oxo-dGTP diphosphatase